MKVIIALIHVIALISWGFYFFDSEGTVKDIAKPLFLSFIAISGGIFMILTKLEEK